MQWMTKLEEALCRAGASAVFAVTMPRVRNTQIRIGILGMQHVGDILELRVKNLLRDAGLTTAFVRYSGLEVIAAVPGLRRLGEISALGEKIRHCCNQTMMIEGQRTDIEPVVGIAISPDDGQCAQELIARAQIAADTGASTHAQAPVFFAGSMAHAVDFANQIETELRKALDHRALSIVFQPQYAVQERRFAAAEVLLRWDHPVLGTVSPGDFIPIAESAGLVSQIGSFALHEAVLQMSAFRRHVAELDLAVNVAPSQLLRDDFVDEVDDLLASTDMPANALTIEITEGELLFDIDLAIHQMQQLRSLGVRTAIDDFGAGFSNLAYLHRLPLDQLKIDQGFVRQLGTDGKSIMLLRSVAELGHGLGLEVCVEGVETPEQLKMVNRLGCDLVQGYFFARPQPLQELPNALSKQAFLAAPLETAELLPN